MNANPSTLATIFLVPHYTSVEKPLRFSEQEARFALIQILNEIYSKSTEPIYYSVETPTTAKYNFKTRSSPIPTLKSDVDSEFIDTDTKSGVEPSQTSQLPSKRSALTDMSLYRSRRDGEPPLCNIEFKAGVATKDAIWKDIEKLSVEQKQETPCEFGWFYHLINRADKATFKRLHENTLESLRAQTATMKQGEETRIVFTYCILADLKNSTCPAWSATTRLRVAADVGGAATDVIEALSWMLAANPRACAESLGWRCLDA